MRTPKSIDELIKQYLEIADLPIQEERKKLWADTNSLKRTERIPFSIYYEGIPEFEWGKLLGAGYLSSDCAIATQIEKELKKLIWLEENVSDDLIKWKSIIVSIPGVFEQDWGVKLETKSIDEKGAYAIIPPMEECIDLKLLKKPILVADLKAVEDIRKKAEDMVKGRLKIHYRYPEMGLCPFDHLVRMRGMENVYLDLIKNPGIIHELMTFITDALIAHLKMREKNNWFNIFLHDGGKYVRGPHRVRASYPHINMKTTGALLKYEWPYISAQTSSGLSPEMYSEFVAPYNNKIAILFTDTVYYHGCESLDRKMKIIAKMSGLRRFHVSPWTNPDLAIATFGRKVVLEVHSNPSDILFSFSEKEIEADTKQRLEKAKEAICDFHLSDIHSINNRPDKLRIWAKMAEKYAVRN